MSGGSEQQDPIPPFENRTAPVMFTLGCIYLITIAGLIHRAPSETVNPTELNLMYGFLAVLWPLFVCEAVIAFYRRSKLISRSRAILRVLLVIVVPPARVAWVHPVTNRIWLPRLGWNPSGKALLRILDRAFGIPMLIFAFLILPVLGMEYAHLVQPQSSMSFRLALDLSIAVIWVAFALEFLVKVSAAPSTINYFKERWLDLAIVGLPTLEFILTRWVNASPLLRLLKLSRALGPEQIAAMSKAYRLRGLMTKGWHAFLLLEGVTRITGNSPEKRLRKIEDQIQELEQQMAELRAQAEELKKQASENKPDNDANSWLPQR